MDGGTGLGAGAIGAGGGLGVGVGEAWDSTLNCDVAFMGSFGVDGERGFSTPNPLEADVNKAVIAQADTVCVLVDHTKWGVRGLAAFADFSDVHHLITDAGVDQSAREQLAGQVPLTVVPVRKRPS